MSANSSEQFAYVENIGNIEENYEYKSIAKANNKAKALLYIEKALKRFIDIIRKYYRYNTSNSIVNRN